MDRWSLVYQVKSNIHRCNWDRYEGYCDTVECGTKQLTEWAGCLKHSSPHLPWSVFLRLKLRETFRQLPDTHIPHNLKIRKERQKSMHCLKMCNPKIRWIRIMFTSQIAIWRYTVYRFTMVYPIFRHTHMKRIEKIHTFCWTINWPLPPTSKANCFNDARWGSRSGNRTCTQQFLATSSWFCQVELELDNSNQLEPDMTSTELLVAIISRVASGWPDPIRRDRTVDVRRACFALASASSSSSSRSASGVIQNDYANGIETAISRAKIGFESKSLFKSIGPLSPACLVFHCSSDLLLLNIHRNGAVAEQSPVLEGVDAIAWQIEAK